MSHKVKADKRKKNITWGGGNVEPLCIETHHKKDKNILFNIMCRPPNMTIFANFCENMLSSNDKTSKTIIFAGDLNITILDYESNKKVQHFLNSMFQYNMIPTINKPTRVTRNNQRYRSHY